MKYLDERIYITVADLIVSFSGLYKYKVIEAGEDELLFIGNLYLEKDQTSVTIDVTDIVRIYLSGRKDHHSFYVNLSIHGEDDYSGESEVVLPFYRYPNRKADDINYDKTSTTYNTILLSGKSKVGENLFEYENNLLPTYPKIQTDKVSINYLYGLKNGAETDSFVFDYGPTQTITDSLTTYIKSIDASLTATGSVTNLEALSPYSYENWSVFSGNATVSFDSGYYLKYSYTTTIEPDEISYEWINGSSHTINVTTFPYSLTITESNNCEEDDWINDFYVYNTNLDYLINTWPSLAYTGKYTGTTVCKVTEDLVTFPSGDITDFDGWTFSDPNWTCTWWKKMTSGTVVSVRFTDSGGVDVVEVDATYDGTNAITWEWNQTEGDLDSAVIYFNNGEFVSLIPLSIVNRQEDEDYAYKTLFFTLKAVNDVPTLTINYGEYTIDITYKNCTVELPVGLSDDIKIYKSDRYTYTQTDNNYTQTVEGDLEFISNRVEGSYACKSYRLSYWQDGICIKKSSLYRQSSGYSEIPLINTPIKDNDYFLVEYFDTSGNYRSGKIYIHPTNSKSNAYYNSKIYFYLSNDNILYGGKLNGSAYYRFFGHYTDTAITIGKLVCPNRYFLLWQDRLGSQQCQPFDKVDTYSEDVEGSEITNYYGKRSLYKVEVQPKWKLQTGWITDDAYRCYEGLFVSPWVKLYDGDSDILYDVILKDRNYTEKNFLNQGKLFNLEVTVEQTEKQNILF